MNPEPTPEQPPTPEAANTLPPVKRRHIPNLFGCAFAALAVLVLAWLILPIFAQTNARSQQTKSLASAKAFGLALKLYAGDNDGKFPTAEGDPAGTPVAGSQAKDANAAFRNLFPTYCSAEKLFFTPKSAYCNPSAPDEVCNTKETCLAAGENNYSYVMGLTDKDEETLPLIVDGTDGTGHYVADRTKRGGLWGGRKAIVIRVDTSGSVVTLAGPDHARFIPRSKEEPTQNLLEASYLNIFHAHLLDPAVAAKP